MLLHLLQGACSCIIPQSASNPLRSFLISWFLIFISKGFSPGVSSFSIFLSEGNNDDQLPKIIFKTASKPKLFYEIILYWNSSCILGKIKLDSLVHLILKCLLGYMIIDHIALTTTNKVTFLLFTLLVMIVLSGKLLLLYPWLIWGTACLF